MKHLRKFNEESDFSMSYFDIINRIIPECEDILLELKDEGIPYEVWQFDQEGYSSIRDYIYVRINYIKRTHRVGNIFNFSKIKPNIEHLISFLRDNFNTNIEVKVWKDLGFPNSKFDVEYYECDSLDELDNKNISMLCLEFKSKNTR